jgi:2-polyprenyl-3-methyl-5-hydroxy-6-metoxy-1,4-benzoquinol methylase
MSAILKGLLKSGVPAVPVGYRAWVNDVALPTLASPVSQLCTHSQFDEPVYEYWVNQIHEQKRYHRKQWEFVYILQNLNIRLLLENGRKGLGFGVGQEPLPALMASRGVSVMATDLDLEGATQKGWATSNQHTTSLDVLNNRGICEPTLFDRLVSFKNVDMNNIPDDLAGYDFCWSSCAFEHLGSIELGLQFVENSLKCLKPGGVAIHTTEYNCQSNRKTMDKGGTVIFRQRDILELAKRLRSAGHQLFLNLNQGSQPLDKHIDMPPYAQDHHLKLQLGKYITTSIGLVVQKA